MAVPLIFLLFLVNTHLWLSAVYIFTKFFLTEVALLVLFLQYLTERTVCRCCQEQPEAFIDTVCGLEM